MAQNKKEFFKQNLISENKTLKREIENLEKGFSETLSHWRTERDEVKLLKKKNKQLVTQNQKLTKQNKITKKIYQNKQKKLKSNEQIRTIFKECYGEDLAEEYEGFWERLVSM